MDERPSVYINDIIGVQPNGDHNSNTSISLSNAIILGHSNGNKDGRRNVTRECERLGCSMCTNKFNSGENLGKHLKLAHDKEEKSNSDAFEAALENRFKDEGYSVDVERVVRCQRNRNAFTCPDCNKTFTRVQRLRIHVDVCHMGENPPFPCFHCDLRFCDSGTLKRHVSIVHSTADRRPVFPCNVCGKEFSRRANLNAHTKRHSDDLSYRCSHCGETFKTRVNYLVHVEQNHVAKRPYECRRCNKRFIFLHMLRRHEENHAEKDANCKPYCCHECLKTYASATSLRAHLQRHSPISASFICVICDQTFTHRQNVWSHIESHCRERPKRPQCPDCGLRTYGLSRHMLTHSSDKPYICSCCKKSFRQLWYLETHMRLHTGERPYSCDDCGMKFHTASYLKNHRQRAHLLPLSGAKRSADATLVKCPFCSKEFSTANPYSMKRHVMAVHENVKPHACDRCGKTFAQFVNLEAHMRLHSGERPFECFVCCKRFAQISNMKLHLQRQHPLDS